MQGGALLCFVLDQALKHREICAGFFQLGGSMPCLNAKQVRRPSPGLPSHFDLACGSVWEQETRRMERCHFSIRQYVPLGQLESGKKRPSTSRQAFQFITAIIITISNYLGDLKSIWKDINKIIDSLHIKNHVDKRCREVYNPQTLKEDNPTFNTMVCEQTFAWLSRYKKIVSSMPKTHHHFFLHRTIKRRNAYISLCYSKGRRLINPHIKQ